MNLICFYCQYNKMDAFKYLLVLCIHSIVIVFQSQILANTTVLQQDSC